MVCVSCLCVWVDVNMSDWQKPMLRVLLFPSGVMNKLIARLPLKQGKKQMGIPFLWLVSVSMLCVNISGKCDISMSKCEEGKIKNKKGKRRVCAWHVVGNMSHTIGIYPLS